MQSGAFERASLKSESYRVVALLCVLAALTVFAIVRGVATQNYLLLIGQIVVLAFVIAHETPSTRLTVTCRTLFPGVRSGCNPINGLYGAISRILPA